MRDPMIGFGLIIELTAIVVVAGLAPLLIGLYLDNLAHTSPFITLFLMILGVTLGTFAVYRQVNAVYNRIAGGKK